MPRVPAVPVPSIVWPPRSSVRLSAPITSPSPGQFLRLLRSVVDFTMTAPQPGSAANVVVLVAPNAVQPIAVATKSLRCECTGPTIRWAGAGRLGEQARVVQHLAQTRD